MSTHISRRKASEKALVESEAKCRKVVENVDEGILVTAGGRLYANPRALELTGLDDETELLVQVAAEMDQAHPQAARIDMRCEGVERDAWAGAYRLLSEVMQLGAMEPALA